MADDQVTDPAAGDELDLDNLPEDGTVPVHVVKAIRTELNDLKGKYAESQDRETIYKSQLRGQAAPQQQQAPPQPAAKASILAGRYNDDIITVGEFEQILEQEKASFSTGMYMQRLTAQPDFKECTEKHFLTVLKTNPDITQEFQQIPEHMRWAIAYRLGKQEKELQEKLTKPANDNAAKVKDNLSKPRSPATVGGAASTDGATPFPEGKKEFQKWREEMLVKAKRAARG